MARQVEVGHLDKAERTAVMCHHVGFHSRGDISALELDGDVWKPHTKSRFRSKKNLNFGAKIKILGFSMSAISNF